jgi:hypothetical protein
VNERFLKFDLNCGGLWLVLYVSGVVSKSLIGDSMKVVSFSHFSDCSFSILLTVSLIISHFVYDCAAHQAELSG